MSLKELIANEKILQEYGITMRKGVPTLRFAEDIKVVGIDIDKGEMAVIPYDYDSISISELKEIILSYSLIGYLTEYSFEKEGWKDKLECVWLDTEEGIGLLETYSKYGAILILKLF